MSFKSAVRSGLALGGLEIRRTGSQKFRPYVMAVDISGIKFDFWIADETASEWYVFDGSTAVAEFQQLRRFVRPGDRVLEIGAHHGYFMMYMSRLVGSQGFIVSVEPHPFNAMIAQAQIGLNQANNCRLIPVAASDQSGGTVFVSNESNGRITPSGGIDVRAITVDELDAQFGPFTALKIDVEGYESKVLDGSRNILRRSPRLMLELHCPHLSDFGVMAEYVMGKIPNNYRGTMILRSDRQAVYEFTGALPNEIVNLFLLPN